MRILSVALIGLSIASCGRQPEEENRFAKAETLYLDQHYDEAIVAFKKYLLDHPNHAGAHFYLGTCYLGSEDNRWLGIAEGELLTAAALFERQDKTSPIPRFSDTYFELICHINLAKVYFQLVFTILDDMPRNLPGIDQRRALEMTLDKCDEQHEILMKIKPDYSGVKWVKEEIDNLRQALSIPRKEKTEAGGVSERSSHSETEVDP